VVSRIDELEREFENLSGEIKAVKDAAGREIGKLKWERAKLANPSAVWILCGESAKTWKLLCKECSRPLRGGASEAGGLFIGRRQSGQPQTSSSCSTTATEIKSFTINDNRPASLRPAKSVSIAKPARETAAKIKTVSFAEPTGEIAEQS
jgi:hypothetical protein